jgi:hypothetical protein
LLWILVACGARRSDTASPTIELEPTTVAAGLGLSLQCGPAPYDRDALDTQIGVIDLVNYTNEWLEVSVPPPVSPLEDRLDGPGWWLDAYVRGDDLIAPGGAVSFEVYLVGQCDTVPVDPGVYYIEIPFEAGVHDAALTVGITAS